MDANPTSRERSVNATRRLDAAARLAASGEVESALASLPWLTDQIARDAASARFDRWARSTVVDEHVGEPVLQRALFDALHARAGLDADWPIGNAGLVHVYGYLLSLTPTPYGLKRERWLGPDLARACGLPDDAFSPRAGAATLLERVTDAATAVLRSPAVSRRERVDGRTLTVALSAATGPAALVYARTDVGGAGSAESSGDGIRLITMFPVADAAAILRSVDDEPDRLRWNAAH